MLQEDFEINLWCRGDWTALSALDSSSSAESRLFKLLGEVLDKTPFNEEALVKEINSEPYYIKLSVLLLLSSCWIRFGRIQLYYNRHEQAIAAFAKAIAVINPKADAKVLSYSLAIRELLRVGLVSRASQIHRESAIVNLSQTEDVSRLLSRVSILETEMDLLHHELSLAQQKQQLSPNSPPTNLEKFETRSPDPSIQGSLEKQSMSQLGQDLWVLEKLNYKRNGFFVEFGATDGVLLSNTWLLEKAFNWSGICIEPNPKLFNQLTQNRSCTCSNDCIAGLDGDEREFILADAYGTFVNYEDCDQHKGKRMPYRLADKVIHVKTKTLNTILAELNAPNNIDYLSIDTEGSELEILENFDFKKWNIKLLTVEHNHQRENRKKIRELLKAHNYQVIAAKWDDWFWRNSE